MTVNGAFDLRRIDVLAARNDHVLDAVLDEHIAILVHVGSVARVHPAVLERAFRRFRQVPVTRHVGRALADEFSDLPARQFFAAFADDLEFDARHRLAARFHALVAF